MKHLEGVQPHLWLSHSWILATRCWTENVVRAFCRRFHITDTAWSILFSYPSPEGLGEQVEGLSSSFLVSGQGYTVLASDQQKQSCYVSGTCRQAELGVAEVHCPAALAGEKTICGYGGAWVAISKFCVLFPVCLFLSKLLTIIMLCQACCSLKKENRPSTKRRYYTM